MILLNSKRSLNKASFFMGRNMQIGKEIRKTTVAGHTEGKK